MLADDGAMLARQRVTTPAGDYAATLTAIVDLIAQLEHDCGQRCRIGVGTPGARSPTSGLLRNANSVWLNDRPFDTDLRGRLGRPIRVANDADCFTLSEATDGAARGAQSVFGVIIGTGTGGGIVIDGRLLAGPNAIAGEWGHNPLPWATADERPGPACYCGKHGCIETFLSGPGMQQDYDDGKQSVTAADIVELAGTGEPAATACLERYEDRLARSLASVINLIDPEVIVLGGGLSRIQRLYHTVPTIWGRYVFSDRVQTRLVPPRHGDSSGVRGAAWLWPPESG